MKVKTCFVTNSSSSSFIVIFPSMVKTIEDVAKYMSLNKAKQVFHDCIEQIPVEIILGEKNSIKVMDFIKHIMLRTLDINVVNQLIEDIQIELKDKYPQFLIEIDQEEYLTLKTLKPRDDWDDICYGCDEDELKKLIKNNNHGFIYRFQYADEDGRFFAELEHGGTFDELPHIQISHH
jgi:hypothetical protein